MRKISATDAARNFSKLLDQVQSEEETFVIVRRGRQVARLEPAQPSAKAALEGLLTAEGPDPEWVKELRALRDSVGVESGADPWPAAR